MTGKSCRCANGTPARSGPRSAPSCPRRGPPTRTPAAATPACSPSSAPAARWPRSAGRNWPACWSSSGGSGPRRPGTAEARRGTAGHLDGGPQMAGEDKDRGAERRVVSPPAVPLLVRPGAAVRAELAPAHDLGADARFPGAGESVVDAGAAAGLALHEAEGTGREEPLAQPGSASCRCRPPPRRTHGCRQAGSIAGCCYALSDPAQRRMR
jgi:hypothetical protein